MIDLKISNLLIYLILFFTTSSNLVFSSPYFDLTLIICLIIYVLRWNETNWYICIILFMLGIYNDILISTPFGYTSSLFLFFYLIDRVGNFFSIPSNTNIKFIIFSLFVLILFSINYFTIYFIYSTSMPFFVNLVSYMAVILFYYPLDFIIGSIQNKYVRVK